MREGYIIIDVGTGNVRVAVADTNGAVLSVERDNVQYIKDELYPDAIYFDPAQLWQQITQLAVQALQRAPGITITAITATSQREGIVLVGLDGTPLIGLPNIDHRGREWENTITDKSNVYQLTGRYPTSLFSALKLVGIRERRADLWNRCSVFLSISDWVQFRLCGVPVYEHSQASETLLYDVAKQDWSDELCSLFGIDGSMLPPLRASGQVLQHILPVQAAAFGVTEQVQIVTGGADTQFAVKSTQPLADDMVIVSGTTTPVVQLVADYITDAQQRTWTSRHLQDGFIFEANAGVTGLNYQRLKEIFYPNEGYEVIEKELAGINGASCVASLGSLIAHEKDPLTQGGFVFQVPVTHQLSRAHFVWATLWDIACSIRENYSVLQEAAAYKADYVWGCGGGFQSPLLRQFLAGLLDKKLRIRNGYQQASVIGGVLVCNKALGQADALPIACEEVQPANQAHYAGLFEAWKKARAAFKQLEAGNKQ
jgi:autoinducer 2 (AI-2) kinase